MQFKMKYTIESRYIPSGTKRRSGQRIKAVIFLVSHDTGNDGSTASQNVSYYIDSANEQSASAHTFIDDKQIIECIPATTGPAEKAWHVLYDVDSDDELYDNDANDSAIGTELCYSWQKGNINNQEAYKRYVWYHAYLCYKFGVNPSTNISGHNELDPSRKTDPYKNALKHMSISKEQFLRDVAAELEDCTGGDEEMTAEEKKAFDDMQKRLDALEKQAAKVPAPTWFVAEFGSSDLDGKINDPYLTFEGWRVLAICLRCM